MSTTIERENSLRRLGAGERDDTGVLLDAGTNEMELLVFQVGGLPCAVNVAKVREVCDLKRATALPEFPEAVEGVFLVRNTTVPSVDLRKCLWGRETGASESEDKHLILEFNDCVLAFRVQGIERIHRVSWQAILPMPQGVGARVPVTGTVLLNGKTVLILDFESIGARLGLSGTTEVPEDLPGATKAKDTYPLVFVDDSPLIRRMMEDALRLAGYNELRVFNDGQEAWDYLRATVASCTAETIRNSVAAIITDIEMPRMDGLHLTKCIREDATLKDLPVILFSSLVSRDNEKKGRRVGATAQVSKPKWQDMTATLLKVLEEVSDA